MSTPDLEAQVAYLMKRMDTQEALVKELGVATQAFLRNIVTADTRQNEEVAAARAAAAKALAVRVAGGEGGGPLLHDLVTLVAGLTPQIADLTARMRGLEDIGNEAWDRLQGHMDRLSALYEQLDAALKRFGADGEDWKR